MLWVLIRIASLHNVCFLWGTNDYYCPIITKYPPYLFHWNIQKVLTFIFSGKYTKNCRVGTFCVQHYFFSEWMSYYHRHTLSCGIKC